MHIGVPAETRANEARVAATPETVKKLVSQGHRVTVQSGAGLPASYIDDAYAQLRAPSWSMRIPLLPPRSFSKSNPRVRPNCRC